MNDALRKEMATEFKALLTQALDRNDFATVRKYARFIEELTAQRPAQKAAPTTTPSKKPAASTTTGKNSGKKPGSKKSQEKRRQEKCWQEE